MSRIAKNSTLKRDAGENFAVLCIENSSEKFAILLKICARGGEFWKNYGPRMVYLAKFFCPGVPNPHPCSRGLWGKELNGA